MKVNAPIAEETVAADPSTDCMSKENTFSPELFLTLSETGSGTYVVKQGGGQICPE